MTAMDENSSEDEAYEPTMNSAVPSMAGTTSDGEGESDLEFTEKEKIESQKKLDMKNEKKMKVPDGIRLFEELEDKTEEALTVFEELEKCTYQTKAIGSSGQEDFMSCICVEDYEDGVNHACVDDDCINRGTKFECVNGYSSCGDDCANQRFQKRAYAKISVIQTDKKGYGVRAEMDLEPDTFVYEYIGEVIDEKHFKKRMVEYDQLKLKHFYFMMLQKGQFIDATRKGSLARFCNHSCNPNCYVEKWVVGDKLKMGIFAKRRILKGEELTFNYNVDRYGANAQPCYCGERNCIGFIGGKTQTDAASLLPQSVSDALGSSIEAEQEFITMKKQNNEKITKSDNNINAEFVKSLVMKPLEIFEANTVMGSLFQCEDYLIASKLIERIELSSETLIAKLKYARGFESFGRLLKFHYDLDDATRFDVDKDLALRVLNIMEKWIVSKNYLSKTKIVPVVEKLQSFTKDDEISSRCKDLLEKWSKFENYQKIEKRTDYKNNQTGKFDQRRNEARQIKRSPIKPETPSNNTPRAVPMDDLPKNWFGAMNEDGRMYYFNDVTKETTWERPSYKEYEKERLERERFRLQTQQEERERLRKEEERRKLRERSKQNAKLERIIREAALAKEKEEEAKLKALEEERRKKERKLKQQQQQQKTSKPYDYEEFRKRWSHYFAQEVPNMVKKYREEIGHDNVKKRGKEIVQTLVDKEYKKDAKNKPPKEMISEKRKKVKQFVETYMEKYLIKFREKRKRSHDADDEDDGENGGDVKKIHHSEKS